MARPSGTSTKPFGTGTANGTRRASMVSLAAVASRRAPAASVRGARIVQRRCSVSSRNAVSNSWPGRLTAARTPTGLSPGTAALARAARKRGLRVTGPRYAVRAPYAGKVSWFPEILPDLPLTTGGLDRSADERRDPSLIERLLADRATRVLELRGEAAYVDLGDVSKAAPAALAWRSPVGADHRSGGVLAFLGRDAQARAHLVSVDPAAAPVPDRRFHSTRPPAASGWRGLRASG